MKKSGSMLNTHIARPTSTEKDFDLNQNLSIIIISHTKMILIKHFCIQKKIKVETHWQMNKSANVFFFRFIFCKYILSDSTYIYIYIYIYIIPGRVIPKTQKMVLDASLLNTALLGMDQRWSRAIEGKELRPPPHLVVIAMEKRPFGSPSTIVANFTYITICIYMRAHTHTHTHTHTHIYIWK